MPTTPVLDAAVLRNLQDLDDEGGFVAELADVFCAETPIRLTALGGCARAGRATDVTSLAHAIKSAARTLGLARMAEALQAVEQGSRAGTVPGPEELQRLETEYQAARDALQAVRGPVEA